MRPLVSVIARISPSPDWFIGVHDIDLCDRKNGKWLMSRKVYPLYPYDAGTDSGAQFTSQNQATSPPRDISRLEGGPLKEWIEKKGGIGVFFFTLEYSSPSGGSETDETFTCPNVASQAKWSYLTLVPTMVLLLLLLRV